MNIRATNRHLSSDTSLGSQTAPREGDMCPQGRRTASSPTRFRPARRMATIPALPQRMCLSEVPLWVAVTDLDHGRNAVLHPVPAFHRGSFTPALPSAEMTDGGQAVRLYRRSLKQKPDSRAGTGSKVLAAIRLPLSPSKQACSRVLRSGHFAARRLMAKGGAAGVAFWSRGTRRDAEGRGGTR
jgi:hypothetical protein